MPNAASGLDTMERYDANDQKYRPCEMSSPRGNQCDHGACQEYTGQHSRNGCRRQSVARHVAEEARCTPPRDGGEVPRESKGTGGEFGATEQPGQIGAPKEPDENVAFAEDRVRQSDGKAQTRSEEVERWHRSWGARAPEARVIRRGTGGALGDAPVQALIGPRGLKRLIFVG